MPPTKGSKPRTLEQALEIIAEQRQKLFELTAENKKLKDQLAKNSLISSKDASEFYEVFFEECFEGLEAMESGLLALQPGSTDMEEINIIFRAARSIKGGSMAFDFNAIASFTHAMETLLDQMRSGQREATTPDIDLLLESVDCLSEMINAARDEELLDEGRITDLKKRLEEGIEDTQI